MALLFPPAWGSIAVIRPRFASSPLECDRGMMAQCNSLDFAALLEIARQCGIEQGLHRRHSRM